MNRHAFFRLVTRRMRTGCYLAFFIFGGAVFSGPIYGQVSHACGYGVTLALNVPVAAQGTIVRVSVRSEAPLADLKADWDGHDLPFWTDETHKNIRHAFIGLDVEKPAGQYALNLHGHTETGARVNCSASISVKDGHFIVERLQVAEKFVDLNPADTQRAIEETKRMRDIYATITPERLWDGPFRLPLAGVRRGGNFGTRRVLNGEPRSPHTGVDFPAPKGTPVHAAQAGRVVLAEPLFFSGNTIIIDHGLGVYTMYGHLSVMSVHAGDTVKAWQLLGQVGATGRVTGPHLHWGLVIDDARVAATQIVGLGGN